MEHCTLFQNNKNTARIVFGMLPYWTPLIPPQGIGMLKVYLQKHGYYVKNVDLNVEETFKGIYFDYFKKMEGFVPLEKRGNFFNIGHDVLHNHMMAAYKHSDEKKYIELVKSLVYHTYYVIISDAQAKELNVIIDNFYKQLEDYYLALVEREKPDVLGFSIFKGNIPASIYAARLVKKRHPQIKIVMGGGAFADSHAMGSPNFDALVSETEDCVDLIMVGGQGEELFLKFLQGEISDRRVVTSKDMGMQPIPFAQLDIADLSDFNIFNYPYIGATGSASCPNECSFCNASKYFGKFRTKDIKQLVSEMCEIYTRYGNQLFFMTDSLLNPIITDVAKEFINCKETLYYDCYFRVDDASADLDNTILWRRGGLYRTRMGIESGSQKILDLMGKGISVEQIKASLYGLASAGIKTTAYLVIGHPGETEEDFQLTLDLLEEMKDYIWQAEPNPFYYHYSGQFASDQWADKRMLVYPEGSSDMLVFDTWTLNCEPSREERYNRLNRFMEHCNKLGIPNPYNATELFDADERWKKLHKNAVPSIWEFKDLNKYVNEAKSAVKLTDARNMLDYDGDFDY